MSNSFFENSKVIANDFIQSIVFLDDRAYKGKNTENPSHDFDAQEITQSFAKEKKICAVYNPTSVTDIDLFKSIAYKADIVILDWQINIESEVNEKSEEEDIDEEDPRGKYTLEIIKDIIENEKGLKLITIYTGETDLNGITEKVFDELKGNNPELIKEPCLIASDNVRILIRAKSNLEAGEEDNRYRHFRELQNKIIKYEDLPEFILEEFTKMTSGLLSNFALMSLTVLRKNSSKILKLFSKDMDSAYLGHKVTIPNQEDAEVLLIELFGDSVKDLLHYNQVNDRLSNEFIERWINENILEDDYSVGTKTFRRTRIVLKKLLESKEESIVDRFSLLDSNLSKGDKNKLIEDSTALFINDENRSKSEEKDKGFAILTHHKSLFIPINTIPKLTLGTVVKSTKQDTYYICIQQRCDSVRIGNGEERKFLFIPLEISDGKFDILTSDGEQLKKNKSTYSIRTIKFICTDDSGVINAEKIEEGKFIFKQKYTEPDDEQFEWILDLKDLHSQRIIVDYTSQLSRVGLDESEWHRKHLS